MQSAPVPVHHRGALGHDGFLPGDPEDDVLPEPTNVRRLLWMPGPQDPGERKQGTMNKKTDITFVIDKSGSMKRIAEAMNSGFDELIDKQQKEPGECCVTLAEFSDSCTILYTARALAEVNHYRLDPGGNTALLDALAQNIQATGKRLAAMPNDERPEHVLFVIITDGQENASREFVGEPGRRAVHEMITHQREKYAWEFLFLGANQDAIAAAAQLGISVHNAVTYTADKLGTHSLNSGLSAGISRLRSGNATRGAVYGQQDYNAQEAEDRLNKPA